MKKHFMAERFFRYMISQFLVTILELHYLSSFVVLNNIALFAKYFLKDLDIRNIKASVH